MGRKNNKEGKMNWLFYLGGGWLFLDIIWNICAKLSSAKGMERRAEQGVRFFASIGTWIWICYRIAIIFGDVTIRAYK